MALIVMLNKDEEPKPENAKGSFEAHLQQGIEIPFIPVQEDGVEWVGGGIRNRCFKEA